MLKRIIYLLFVLCLLISIVGCARAINVENVVNDTEISKQEEVSDTTLSEISYFVYSEDKNKIYKDNIEIHPPIVKVCDDENVSSVIRVKDWLYYILPDYDEMHYELYKIRTDGTDRQKVCALDIEATPGGESIHCTNEGSWLYFETRPYGNDFYSEKAKKEQDELLEKLTCKYKVMLDGTGFAHISGPANIGEVSAEVLDDFNQRQIDEAMELIRADIEEDLLEDCWIELRKVFEDDVLMFHIISNKDTSIRYIYYVDLENQLVKAEQGTDIHYAVFPAQEVFHDPYLNDVDISAEALSDSDNLHLDEAIAIVEADFEKGELEGYSIIQESSDDVTQPGNIVIAIRRNNVTVIGAWYEVDIKNRKVRCMGGGHLAPDIEQELRDPHFVERLQ